MLRRIIRIPKASYRQKQFRLWRDRPLKVSISRGSPSRLRGHRLTWHSRSDSRVRCRQDQLVFCLAFFGMQMVLLQSGLPCALFQPPFSTAMLLRDRSSFGSMAQPLFTPRWVLRQWTLYVVEELQLPIVPGGIDSTMLRPIHTTSLPGIPISQSFIRDRTISRWRLQSRRPQQRCLPRWTSLCLLRQRSFQFEDVWPPTRDGRQAV